MPVISKLKKSFKETAETHGEITDMINGSVNIQLMIVNLKGAHLAVYNAIQWLNKSNNDNENKHE